MMSCYELVQRWVWFIHYFRVKLLIALRHRQWLSYHGKNQWWGRTRKEWHEVWTTESVISTPCIYKCRALTRNIIYSTAFHFSRSYVINRAQYYFTCILLYFADCKKCKPWRKGACAASFNSIHVGDYRMRVSKVSRSWRFRTSAMHTSDLRGSYRPPQLLGSTNR